MINYVLRPQNCVLIAFLFTAISVNAETVEDVSKKVRSPEQLEKFYADGFKSVLKLPDHKQSPQQTLNDKAGDCSDFAELTQAVFKEIGISGEIVVIKFANDKFGHAIFVWKENGRYNYFDTTTMKKTKFTSIQDLMDNVYSNKECCTACKKKLDAETLECVKQ